MRMRVVDDSVIRFEIDGMLYLRQLQETHP